ncbi:hypothetical protein [uncultured Marivita sp.]|uniref:hypothetical protein n=1 Tax=uncultured Marivita sp. TaxID=888080 RepID=UPI00261FFFDD|nr:hypothetical protein [uncultured Marivita sp.]
MSGRGALGHFMIRHRTRTHPSARKRINSTQVGKPDFDWPERLGRAVDVRAAATEWR